MSRIELSRLSKVLGSLASPQAKAGGKVSQNESGEAKVGRNGRSIPALRSSLKSRLKTLRQMSAEDFDSAAPIVLIQEILIWEFGSEIAEHDAFKKAAASISDALQVSTEAQGSLKRLIAQLGDESL